MTDEELLLEMYKGQVARSEHYENLRSAVTNVVLTISAAFIALVGLDSKLSRLDASWGVALVALGTFGFAAVRLHSMRSRRHGKRAAAYRDAIDLRRPSAEINATRMRVPEEKTHLHRIWAAVHLAIAAAGVVVVFLSLVFPD